MDAQGIFVTRAEYDELAAQVRAILNTGLGAYLTGGIGLGGIGVDISALQQAATVDPDSNAALKAGFWARITSASAYLGDTTCNQWSYAFTRVTNQSAGYEPGSWPLTDTLLTGTAYNTLEVMNSAVGVQGNGVDVANLPAGFAIQPCPIGAIVWMRFVGSGNTSYIFEYANGIDGQCP